MCLPFWHFCPTWSVESFVAPAWRTGGVQPSIRLPPVCDDSSVCSCTSCSPSVHGVLHVKTPPAAQALSLFLPVGGAVAYAFIRTFWSGIPPPPITWSHGLTGNKPTTEMLRKQFMFSFGWSVIRLFEFPFSSGLFRALNGSTLVWNIYWSRGDELSSDFSGD